MEAKLFAEKAVALARERREPAHLARALKALGQIERDQGDREHALALYREAEALEKQGGDTLRLAHTVRHVGDILRELGRWDEAARCYEQALAIYRTEPTAPVLDFANALRPMAIVKTHKREQKEAQTLWQEARQLYARAGVAEGVAECDAQLEKLSSLGGAA